MGNEIPWLRISCCVGAVADGVATLRMLFPRPAYGSEYRYALGLAASLMLGWTFLLIWADIRPSERKGVVLLTAFPVVAGLLLAQIYSVVSGLVTFGAMLPERVFLVALIGLFSFSYFNAQITIRSSETTPHSVPAMKERRKHRQRQFEAMLHCSKFHGFGGLRLVQLAE